ncbi:MAG: hypothetical protein ABI810_19800 [Sphingomonas bacterium]
MRLDHVAAVLRKIMVGGERIMPLRPQDHIEMNGGAIFRHLFVNRRRVPALHYRLRLDRFRSCLEQLRRKCWIIGIVDRIVREAILGNDALIVLLDPLCAGGIGVEADHIITQRPLDRAVEHISPALTRQVGVQGGLGAVQCLDRRLQCRVGRRPALGIEIRPDRTRLVRIRVPRRFDCGVIRDRDPVLLDCNPLSGFAKRLHAGAERLKPGAGKISRLELRTGHAGEADLVLFGWDDGHLSAPPI